MGINSASDQFVIGVDYGTLSGRALVVRVSDGVEFGSAVFEYPHSVMDTALSADFGGTSLPPEWALQVPADYVAVLKNAVPAAIKQAGIDAAQVIGITTDFTACTILPVLADGTPLCELPEYVARPHAYVKLWKHHAAQPHADRINQLARDRTVSSLLVLHGLHPDDLKMRVTRAPRNCLAIGYSFMKPAPPCSWRHLSTISPCNSVCQSFADDASSGVSSRFR